MALKTKILLTTTGLGLATFCALNWDELLRLTEGPGAHQASVIQPLPAGDGSFFSLFETERLFGETINPPPLKTGETEAMIFDRDAILSDHEARIHENFRVPEGLRKRVAFWFDVYTKYDSNRRVVHHSRHPWVIFKVVDVSPIINSDQPRRRWMRNEKADRFVKSEVEDIKKALRRLSRAGAKPQTELEKEVAAALADLGGKLHVQARRALTEVRVQVGQKEHFTEGLRVSQRYLGTMEEIFERHRLPVELSRIPFVESSFNKHATSKVGASGIWQFMGGTGRKFMRVDDWVDERRSPYKATEGAARLLKENHMILHRSWPLAVTAWNHGPPGIRRAIRAAGSKDISVIVSRYRSKSFDFASSNFYAEFLAALHAERYSPEIFGSLIREPALHVDLVQVPKRMPIAKIIEVSGLSLDEFLRINPDLSERSRRRGTVPAGFRMHIPSVNRAEIEKLFFLRPTAARLAPSEG